MMKKYGGLIIALVVAAILGILYGLGLMELAEFQGLDILFKVRGPRPISPNIVVIEVDDAALENFGRWPWPRGYHAEFLDMIEKYHPKAVVFDMLFSEPQSEHPEEDEKLAAMSRKLGNVFFASSFDLEADKVSRHGILKAKRVILPIPGLSSSAKGFGFVNILVEPDGKVRKMPVLIEYDGSKNPSIDVLAASYFLGVGPEDLYRYADKRGLMWINYIGPFDRFTRVSFSAITKAIDDVDTGKTPVVDPNILNGKVVIVGLTATASEDYWSTSFAPLYPGVGIRANSIDTLLRHDFIHRISPAASLIIIFIMAAGIGIVVPKRTPLQGLVFFIIAVSALIFLAMAAFKISNLWVDFVTALLACLLAYPAITLNQFVITRFEKGLIEKELQIASRIQQSILPHNLPQAAGIEIGVMCVPAKHVGGDFYDFIKLIYDFVKLKEDRLGVVIGDVSGKGVPAALYMAKAMADFRGLTHNYNEPNEAMTAINDRLVDEGISGMFVTLQYLIYKPKERKVIYSNGGHNPLIWVKRTGDVVSLTQSVGSPVGIIPGAEFAADEFPVEGGDIFVMYTDGISEARDRNQKEFGERRILDTAFLNRRLPAQGLAEKLVAEVVKFSEGMPQHDDMTVIVLKIL